MDRIEVLGPLRVLRDGRTLSLPPAQRRLLAILLLEGGAEVDRETLIDRMWGDGAPATAVTALQVHVSGLRRAMRGLVRTTSSGYLVEIGHLTHDRHEFESSARAASAAAGRDDWAAVLGRASDGLDRWRGTPFAELRDDGFALVEISRLGDLRLSLTELRARALLALGRHAEASDFLAMAVKLHPLREPLWEQLMLAQYRLGRRAESLRTYEQLRRILAVDLGVEPNPTLRELHERLLAADLQLGATAATEVRLPLTGTTFVGREDDVRQLADLLAAQRLVSIVGGPGMGKTRLALETGHAVVERYPAGVWFASLAESRTRLEAVGAIVTATGTHDHARDFESVVRRLAPRSGLLILDNCEHLPEVCAEFVTRVLAAGPKLSILVTSRRALGVGGERLWAIAPLPVPNPDAPPRQPSPAVPWAPVAASPAARLFVDRARNVDRSFQLTATTAPRIADLCRRAEGIPLVLELAARWVAALGIDDIADMLESEPPDGRADGRGHHRSLAAAIEWSMALLPPEDRHLFVLCALFNGRFGLGDIRAVCAPDRERRHLARAVAGLVDASLLVVERQADGTALYRLLAPIREFVHGQGTGTMAWAAARQRLAAHYLAKAYADQADPLRQVIDLASVDRDLDNLRHAFPLGLELGLADEVARQLVSLGGYFLNRYLVAERQFWLERALSGIADPLTRAHALRTMGSGSQVLGQLDRSLDYFRQALAIFRGQDDVGGLTQCLLSLSGLLAMRGDWSDGITTAREARGLAAGVQSTSGLAVAAYYLGENLAYRGDVAPALVELEEAARLFLAAGETGRAAYALGTLTTVAALSGERESALGAGPRGLALAETSGSVYRRVHALGASAIAQAIYGELTVACAMLVEAHELMRPYELDDVFQFLLPAALVLRRVGQETLLGEVLEVAEEAIARSSLGCPMPWRSTIDELSESLAPSRVGAGARTRPTREMEQVKDAVLAELERRAAAENGSPPLGPSAR